MLFTKTLKGCEIVGKKAAWVGEDIGRLKVLWLGLGPAEELIPEEKLDGLCGKTAEDDTPAKDGTVGSGGAE